MEQGNMDDRSHLILSNGEQAGFMSRHHFGSQYLRPDKRGLFTKPISLQKRCPRYSSSRRVQDRGGFAKSFAADILRIKEWSWGLLCRRSDRPAVRGSEHLWQGPEIVCNAEDLINRWSRAKSSYPEVNDAKMTWRYVLLSTLPVHFLPKLQSESPKQPASHCKQCEQSLRTETRQPARSRTPPWVWYLRGESQGDQVMRDVKDTRVPYVGNTIDFACRQAVLTF